MGATSQLVDDVARLLGEPVTFERYLGRKGRAVVARVRRDGGGTVVVKGPRRPLDDDGPDDDGWSPLGQFRNELASLRVLDGAGGVVPRLLAWDLDRRWMVLEDLGETTSLADHLLGGDPVSAARALAAWGTALGALHRASSDPGVVRRCEQERLALGGSAPSLTAASALATALPVLEDLVEVADSVAVATKQVDRRLSDRRWWAITPGDACPDNCAIQANGAASLFDFEGGGARHALLDAAYLVTTFPTCWCVGELPQGARDSGIDAYRAAAGWPGEDFDAQLAAAAAFWGLWALGQRRLAEALGPTGGVGWRYEEAGFDVPPARQVVALLVDELELAVADDDELAPLAGLASSLRTTLAARWGSWEHAPCHAAFGGRS